ncbi:MAG: CofH family radical SAM protein [Bacteroidales bacterium]|nr:CofH family radical SAM protein [Bacteroidales bacterium]
MNSETIIIKALQEEELTLNEALFLYKNTPISTLLNLANSIRFKKIPQRKVSWQIDMNINYTNVCISACKFCNFHCTLSQKERSYTTSLEEYKAKIDNLLKEGGNQLLLQGGLHPHYGIEFYEQLFRELKNYYPALKLNALGPPEVAHIARLSNLSIRRTLERLVEAGLDSLPGAGAEILSDRVRKIISPGKPNVNSWKEVMECAHSLGLGTTATMVYGHIESIEERIEHLFILRDIQNKKEKDVPGFTAFIAWPMQLKGTKLGELYNIDKLSAIEHLKMVALSRIILYNIGHIQVSWLTIGKEIAKIALHSGADDMGSIMIEENVVSSAGAKNRLNKESMQKTIKEAGFEPWLRNQDYTPYNPNLEANLV